MEKEKLTGNKILDIMRDRGFLLNMESVSNNVLKSMYFMSEPVMHRRRDKIIIPSFGCEVTVEGEFRFFYMIPGSTNKLESAKCSPFENSEHFFKICNKFEDHVRCLYEEFGD